MISKKSKKGLRVTMFFDVARHIMKKIVIFITALLLLSVVSIGIFASEGASVPEDNSDFVEKAVNEASPLSEKVKDAVAPYISDIFCILTFISTVAVAVVYKKGLLPSVSNAIGSMNASAGNLAGKLSAFAESTDGKISELYSKLEPVLAGFSGITEALAFIADENAKIEGELAIAKDESERTKMLIMLQNDLLYTVFMGSGIPQYQKDAIAESYLKIKGMLSSEKSGE